MMRTKNKRNEVRAGRRMMPKKWTMEMEWERARRKPIDRSDQGERHLLTLLAIVVVDDVGFEQMNRKDLVVCSCRAACSRRRRRCSRLGRLVVVVRVVCLLRSPDRRPDEVSIPSPARARAFERAFKSPFGRSISCLRRRRRLGNSGTTPRSSCHF